METRDRRSGGQRRCKDLWVCGSETGIIQWEFLSHLRWTRPRAARVCYCQLRNQGYDRTRQEVLKNDLIGCFLGAVIISCHYLNCHLYRRHHHHFESSSSLSVGQKLMSMIYVCSSIIWMCLVQISVLMCSLLYINIIYLQLFYDK